jgi:hypothetical protein
MKQILHVEDVFGMCVPSLNLNTKELNLGKK